jgi:protein tyrosine phosphatase
LELLEVDGGAGYCDEYESIQDGEDSEYEESKKHRFLNRYSNINAYDHSRVMVKPDEHNDQVDYINANYIPGFHHEKEFIATQGPLIKTFYSFWQMVWEHGSSVIVMVTNLQERGRVKCHKYWPDSECDTEYGDIAVSNVTEEVFDFYARREFKLARNGEERVVVQFQFLDWPDHGAPSNTASMLEFREVVRQTVGGKASAPIVTHCSAGVGRTGTFIAIDRLVQALEHQDAEQLDVREVVASMRRARFWMVQAQAQYDFVYQALRDAIMRRLQPPRRTSTETDV